MVRDALDRAGEMTVYEGRFSSQSAQPDGQEGEKFRIKQRTHRGRGSCHRPYIVH